MNDKQLTATHGLSQLAGVASAAGGGVCICYLSTVVPITRVQTGVRVEPHLLKVLKALAEYLDLSLGDLLEGIVLHTFERQHPFDKATIAVIDDLKRIYGLDLRAEDSHQLQETEEDLRS